MIVEHTFKPIYDKNRFWKLISTIWNKEYPASKEDEKNIILKNNLALFDVVKSCSIKNSSDSSMCNVKINDINSIINNSNIKKIIFKIRK